MSFTISKKVFHKFHRAPGYRNYLKVRPPRARVAERRRPDPWRPRRRPAWRPCPSSTSCGRYPRIHHHLAAHHERDGGDGAPAARAGGCPRPVDCGAAQRLPRALRRRPWAVPLGSAPLFRLLHPPNATTHMGTLKTVGMRGRVTARTNAAPPKPPRQLPFGRAAMNR